MSKRPTMATASSLADALTSWQVLLQALTLWGRIHPRRLLATKSINSYRQSHNHSLYLFLIAPYSMAPAPQDSLTEQPIISEERATPANKWNICGRIQELGRLHRLKKLQGAPGVRQSLLAILKTSCKTFTGCCRPA
jgi:hypothetical protein